MKLSLLSPAPGCCPHCGHNLDAERRVRIGRLDYDPAGPVSWGGAPIALTSGERIVLGSLVHARGAIVSRSAIAERMGSEGDGNVVDVLISRLRKALSQGGAPRGMVRTCRGRGYALDAAWLEAEGDGRCP